MTCFYCNYSVSDWEPTDDPWCAAVIFDSFEREAEWFTR